MLVLVAQAIVDSFWSWTAGNVSTVLALLISFWAAHLANVKRLNKSAAELAVLQQRVEMIYRWFENNVIGKGEPPRGRGNY